MVPGARRVGTSTLLAHALEGQAEFVVFGPVVDVENARRIDRDQRLGQYVLTGSRAVGVAGVVWPSGPVFYGVPEVKGTTM